MGEQLVVMVGKLEKQTITGELESHWVSHNSSLVPQLSLAK